VTFISPGVFFEKVTTSGGIKAEGEDTIANDSGLQLGGMAHVAHPRVNRPQHIFSREIVRNLGESPAVELIRDSFIGKNVTELLKSSSGELKASHPLDGFESFSCQQFCTDRMN
jgi:hypothetical protein